MYKLNLSSLKLFILSILLAFTACKSEEKKDKNVENAIEEAIEVDEQLVNNFNKAKQVFYALPSPIETLMLIKRSGASYDEELLNPTENLANYNTTKARAINLGIFSADLSYSSLFDQTQTSIRYMSASKRLADELGILNAIDETTISRLERNVNNRDSVMDILSDSFSNSNTFLKENDRAETAALIIAGGWLEGLYIATQLAQTTESNNELIDRIIDQKISLETLMSLLSEFPENPDLTDVINQFNEIKSVYDKIQVVSSKVEPDTDSDAKITTLKAKTDIFISEQVFDSLLFKVNKIRNEVVR
jgi:hypothetical protein